MNLVSELCGSGFTLDSKCFLDFKDHSKGELRASMLAESMASGLRNLSQIDLHLLPSSFFLLPSSFFLLPSAFFLLPSSLFLLSSSFFLLPFSCFPLCSCEGLRWAIALHHAVRRTGTSQEPKHSRAESGRRRSGDAWCRLGFLFFLFLFFASSHGS